MYFKNSSVMSLMMGNFQILHFVINIYFKIFNVIFLIKIINLMSFNENNSTYKIHKYELM
jgi:hypothetical protein